MIRRQKSSLIYFEGGQAGLFIGSFCHDVKSAIDDDERSSHLLCSVFLRAHTLSPASRSVFSNGSFSVDDALGQSVQTWKVVWQRR